MPNINETISALRRKKGITQEELGRALNVSMQAVSRWENGGAPDTMMLPALADYFGVSVDELFSRKAGPSQAESAILDRLSALPDGEEMNAAFKLLWEIQRGIAGEKEYQGDDIVSRFMTDGSFTHSRMNFDYGISEMRVGKSHSWFFLSPEPEEGRYQALYNKEKQVKLFKLLSEPDAYDALFMILQRDKNPFTAKLLEKSLNIQTGRAVEILRAFEEFHLLSHSTLELDDEQITIYNLRGSESYVIPFLTFAEEMTDPPESFNYHYFTREQPFLRGK